MNQRIVGRNPLFLRDEELDRTLELLLLAEREIFGRTAGILAAACLAETDFRILYLVHRHPGTTMAELCGVLGLSKQSISRHIRQLMARGLLDQGAPRGDRRTRPLAATEAALQQLATLGHLTKRDLRRAFMNAGPEAVEGFQRVLSELIDGPARRWAHRRAA